MRLSHGTRIEKWRSDNGYGYATDKIIESMRYLGHDVRQNDPDAPVQFWFDQPEWWTWNKADQYRIGYHPWESTKLYRKWVVKMNACDEIWTPSPLVQQWYQEQIHAPVYLYEHGVDSKVWTPKKRKVEDKFRVLHVGGEAVRKGGDIALDAFRMAFQGNKDCELVLKMNSEGFRIPQYGQVKIINKLPLEELVKLYHDSHLFVYPSWGEGFGLTPLQAAATGMPVIYTDAWCPYNAFMPFEGMVNSELVDSPWPKLHPGKMFKPNFDEVVDKMRWAYDNYDEFSGLAYSGVDDLVDYYDWNRLTKEVMDDLEKRLKN